VVNELTIQLFVCNSSFFRTVQALNLCRRNVKIHFDWRIARVIDDDGNILDELLWDGHRSASNLSKRLEAIKNGKQIDEIKTLLHRFPDSSIDYLGHLSDPEWPIVTTEDENLLNQASIFLARKGVAEAAGDMDRRLEMLTSSLIELRSSWTTLESRIIEWVGLFISEADLKNQRSEIPIIISESKSISEAAKSLNSIEPIHYPSENEWKAIKEIASKVTEISTNMNYVEDAIREICTEYIPSLSLLLGPISAAKLVSLAGSRERLARMPSGSLQVLGAHSAMSAHRKGAPPPKHGSILFSMPQISRSPRWVRGKISRFLAGKASIAVRVDHFNGQTWNQEIVDQINDEIQSIKKKFPKPPKRK